ncbi:Fatty acid desaturase [Rhizoctonia solani]|uniref:Fatty acid desaturase n=1 Tax=Rhizoctonia solani TaxID=456999 RepID=A0A8H8NU49_9AGAM|nr:Fatty acid desaturase [Rhizoctonia solani]QRW19939.1 Fatty acid desaturase [Rhizoctonia solani]
MGQRQKAKAAARVAAAANSRSPSPKLGSDGPEKFVVPELSVKDCLSVIPPHCFERSALRSFSYVAMDLLSWALSTTQPLPKNLQPIAQSLSPHLYSFARFAGWQVYALGAGLVGTGLWIIAHECGHQAFSTSKTLNNAPREASCRHEPLHTGRSVCSKNQKPEGLPPLDPAKEDLAGGRVDEKVQEELVDALGDSPLGAALGVFALLLFGWPLYLIMNISGQKHYPAWTNHFVPKAPLFQPHQYSQILFSDFGIFLWLGTLIWWSMQRGFAEMFRVYFVPYLWVNHWLILITFLQHTDPLLPHYRQSAFTFTRGALSTMDRNLLGGEGFIASITGWLGATLTHGISETHVLHHVCSKIPTIMPSRHLKARLARAGYSHEGRPGTWGEVYRVWKECRFIEDEGDVVFYKNARGLAARQAVFANEGMSDSGVDVKEQSE